MFFKGGIIFNLKREKDKQTIKKARFLVFRNSRFKKQIRHFENFKAALNSKKIIILS